MESLRAAVIKLAHAKPELRAELLPLLDKEAAVRHNGEIWQTASGNWRAKNQAGNSKSFSSRDDAQAFAKSRAEGDKHLKPSGRERETHEEREKREKAEAEAKAKPKTKLPPKAQKIADENNLTDDDNAEIKRMAPQLADKTAKRRMSAEERKKKFLANMDASKYSPEELKAMKERIQKMPAGEFEKMVFAILDDEEGGGEMAKMAKYTKLARALLKALKD